MIVAFLTFLHMFGMVQMNITLVAIVLLGTSMSKTYLTKTGSKRYLIKTGARHRAREMRTTPPTSTKIENEMDDDHVGGLGEDEVCVKNV